MVALRRRTGQSALSTRRSAPLKLSGRIGTYRGQLLKVLGMAEARSAGVDVIAMDAIKGRCHRW